MNPPDDRRAEVLRLVAEFGQAETARRTGIPLGTVKSWARRGGVTSEQAERVRPANEARSALWAERRADTANRLGVLATRLISAIEAKLEDPNVPLRDLTGALTAAVDRAQLLSGSATERVESGPIVERTPQHEAQLAQVLDIVRRTA